MKFNRLVFKNAKYCEKSSEVEVEMNNKEPWLYLWTTGSKNRPIYIGEYGRSDNYNLLKRLRYSIGELKSSTLNQVEKNYPLTGGNIFSRFNVYAFPLDDGYECAKKRKGVESWLHWLIVIKHKLHHPKYCAFNYRIPPGELNTKEYIEAKDIYSFLRNKLAWKNS